MKKRYKQISVLDSPKTYCSAAEDLISDILKSFLNHIRSNRNGKDKKSFTNTTRHSTSIKREKNV